MKFKPILTNIINKSPKLLLFMVVLLGLSLHADSFFGGQWSGSATGSYAKLPTQLVERYFGAGQRVSTDDSIFFQVGTRGFIISSAKMTDQWRGYGGATPVAIILDSMQVIRGVAMLANHETGRFVERLEQNDFFERWNGRHILDPYQRVEAVSGATFTSTSVIANVDAALGAVVSSRQRTSQGGLWAMDWGSWAVLVVVALSLWCFCVPSRTRWLRLPLLVTSIGVLGIWQGAFVSVQLLYNWLIYGVSWQGSIAIMVVVVLAIILPVVTNKSYYCQYLCPFGACQQVMGKITKRKLPIPSRAVRIFHWVRRLALVGIVLLLLANPKFEPSDVEPFTVFMIRSASLSVIIIAGLSLVGSIFMTRPWCRLLCPTGEILSIMQRKLKIKRFWFW